MGIFSFDTPLGLAYVTTGESAGFEAKIFRFTEQNLTAIALFNSAPADEGFDFILENGLPLVLDQ